MKKIILLYILIFSLHHSFSQAEVDKVENKIDSIERKVDDLISRIQQKKAIRFGLSIGYRQAFSVASINDNDKFLAEASISPVDSTLQVDLSNRHSFLISAVISVYPFNKKTDKWYKNLGFYGNVNIAEIASNGNFESIFNKQIEGGMGFSYKFSKEFAIGLGYEFIFHRRIRDYLFDSIGQKIHQNGNVITSLDINDGNIFRSDNVHAFSLKFIFYL